ncbi:dynein regulatory complex protein 10-like isoform X2 [Aricia agestis]|uniref:dynein regulatory complex protein 10-like isoform X2 n=1 Tax=Aricia agestis TaxID=91739 RepID=UPI001C205605|nr:dynein regulatory complex protein 10-like isoform X2 [Aricia agestis]
MDATSSETLQSPSIFSSTSKFDSSRSGSDDKISVDLTKDNVTSPLDLECKIQAERITKILDETVLKTKLALCLPNLVQEYRTLSSILTPQHMEDLTYIFEQYDSPLFSVSLLNVSAMEDLKEGDVPLKNRLNPELGHLVYIIHSYPALRTIAEEMVEDMKKEFIHNESQEMPPGLRYLLTLERFRELMIKQMEITAEEELTTKISTRKLQASNEKLMKKIKEYTDTLNTENTKFEKTMEEKRKIISNLEKELATLELDAEVELKKKVLLSDRDMVLATRGHLVKKEMLREEEHECREAYENLLKTNLTEEKNLRMRRFKVETQLLSWLQKYDIEMSEKQVELDDFTEKYDEEMQKCEDLEEKIAEQDIEYIPLMEEREKEYHQEMTEKMNKFLLEHAARVIQAAWRQVLASRAEKKRAGRKGKKKKKT